MRVSLFSPEFSIVTLIDVNFISCTLKCLWECCLFIVIKIKVIKWLWMNLSKRLWEIKEFGKIIFQKFFGFRQQLNLVNISSSAITLKKVSKCWRPHKNSLLILYRYMKGTVNLAKFGGKGLRKMVKFFVRSIWPNYVIYRNSMSEIWMHET